jgi:hypothetical protein
MGRAKLLGPVLKLLLCICVLPSLLILWPVVGIVGSIISGAAYGFLSPIFATFDAVGEGKTNKLFHCFYVCLPYSISVILYFYFLSHFAIHKRAFSVTTFAGWNSGNYLKELRYCQRFFGFLSPFLLFIYG